MFAFRGPCCGGFFVQIKSEQSLRQSYLVISCKLCYLILFLLFNFYQIQILDYIKGENAAKLLHYVFMKWGQLWIYTHTKIFEHGDFCAKKDISSKCLNHLSQPFWSPFFFRDILALCECYTFSSHVISDNPIWHIYPFFPILTTAIWKWKICENLLSVVEKSNNWKENPQQLFCNQWMLFVLIFWW